MIRVSPLLVSALLVAATLAGCSAFSEERLDECALETEIPDKVPTDAPVVDSAEIEHPIIQRSLARVSNNTTVSEDWVWLEADELTEVRDELVSLPATDEHADRYVRYENQTMSVTLFCNA